MTHTIHREIELPATVQDVWEAVTDPDALSEWLADEVSLDLRPGGEARFVSGDEIRRGWVEEIAPPPVGEDAGSGRLAFWWAVDDEPASRVCFTVAGREDGTTVLRIVETRPLAVLDLVGVPLPGHGGARFGPALVAAGA
ncbi:MAG: SRPBCC domain-containing protein [Solirubrobacteraceae bacterium]